MHEPAQWSVFAGIDWGEAHHQLCVVNAHGQQQLQHRVTHDVAGLHELDLGLARFGSRLPIALERAEGLLVERLQAAGHLVFPVSPRIAARSARRSGAWPTAYSNRCSWPISATAFQR